MSDYISKSALIDIIVQNVVITTEEGLDLRSEIVDLIKNQPTIDEKEIIRKPMERIIERLKGKKKTLCGTYDFYTKPLDRPSCKIAFNNGICESIEVVKEEGGIE